MLKHRFLPPRYCQTACYLLAVNPASNGLASVTPACLEFDLLLLRFVAGLAPTAGRCAGFGFSVFVFNSLSRPANSASDSQFGCAGFLVKWWERKVGASKVSLAVGRTLNSFLIICQSLPSRY